MVVLLLLYKIVYKSPASRDHLPHRAKWNFIPYVEIKEVALEEKCRLNQLVDGMSIKMERPSSDRHKERPIQHCGCERRGRRLKGRGLAHEHEYKEGRTPSRDGTKSRKQRPGRSMSVTPRWGNGRVDGSPIPRKMLNGERDRRRCVGSHRPSRNSTAARFTRPERALLGAVGAPASADEALETRNLDGLMLWSPHETNPCDQGGC